jgi:hypothetical protein
LGDHPTGAYWSAFRLDGSLDGDTEADFTVGGTHLRLMWDEGAGPLWGDEGLLPADPDWLRQALGLSDSLIADLLQWVRDMDEARERGQSQVLLNPRALHLADRLQAEVGSRFRFRFHPWWERSGVGKRPELPRIVKLGTAEIRAPSR